MLATEGDRALTDVKKAKNKSLKSPANLGSGNNDLELQLAAGFIFPKARDLGVNINIRLALKRLATLRQQDSLPNEQF